MAAIQLNFTLRTSSKCKTVHLVGSWDNYKSNLPLNKDSSKSGGWRGTFRFSSPTLMPGGRYWYYYIIDGYQVSHDPARECTIEPTTGRKLNILDIPGAKPSTHHDAYGGQTYTPNSRSRGGPVTSGRALSPSQIQHPYPSRPYETSVFRSDKFSSREMEALSRRYAAQRLADSSSDTDTSDSDGHSAGGSSSLPSLSSRSSHNSSPSSVSSVGTPLTPHSAGGSPDLPPGYGYAQGVGLGISGGGTGCVCQRWAYYRDGTKARIDCKGTVCAGDSGSGCSESSSEDERRRGKKSHRSSRSGGKSRKGGLRIRR